jgi:GPH family glycoside/pentoside/hexuronide:cation symporter
MSALTIREKASYACGTIPFGLGFMVLGQLAFPIYNLTLGVSATLVGAALAAGRLWDAISDPVMGSLSDNARTRWGRRRPFILLGGVLLAVALPLLWSVPASLEDTARFAWIIASILFFYTATTVYSVPWLSLGYELNPDPLERTRLQAWRAYFGAVATVSVAWFYRWAQADVFADTVEGIRWISVAAGGIILLCTLPVILFCRERPEVPSRSQATIPFWSGLRDTFKNRAFLILVSGIVTPMLCIPMLVGSLAVYINSYHVFAGDTKTGAAYAAAFSSAMFLLKFVFVPVGVRLVARFGKIPVIRWVLWLGLLASLAKFVLYTPSAPWLQFVNALLLAPSVTIFWLLVDPMKADCADFDELQTGRRRSATYAAIANWIEKATMTVVLLGSGLLIDWSGFSPDLGAAQPEGTLLFLRLAFALVPAAAFAIALVALRFYPLDEARTADIRARLAARAAAASEIPGTNPLPTSQS